jgi:hypothetical protein
MLEQLELFQVLNQEQLNEVDSFIKRQNQQVIDRVASIKKTIDMLTDAGFEEGVNFDRSVETGVNTTERSFGWGDNRFTHEVTFNTVSGGVYLKHKRFYAGELKSDESMVSLEGDKLMCSRITPQYRAYKPSSLLVKLNEHNEDQQWRFDSYVKKSNLLDYTLDKYKKLYSNATVQKGTGYVSNRSFTTVLVSFESGSWVEFKLGFRQDEEYMFKKFDATVDALKGMDLLNHFNEQK